MPQELKSSEELAMEFAEKISDIAEAGDTSALTVTGETNLQFRDNLCVIADELEAGFEGYLNALCSNSKTIQQVAFGFTGVDMEMIQKMKGGS